jgi:DNA-binding MarR family transcriptional regulator
MKEPHAQDTGPGVGPGDEITALVFQLAGELATQIARDVAPLELTQPQALLIRHLRQALPMRTAAGRLHCDASNLTGIVDRLEKRGLVERRTVAIDRRVKELVLTETGRHLQERLDELATEAPGLSNLTPDDQEALIRLLRRALELQLAAAERPAVSPI